MTNPRHLAGVLPIVHTPFTDGDAIDEDTSVIINLLANDLRADGAARVDAAIESLGSRYV